MIMKLPDKVYDVLKWVITLVLPATATFFDAIGPHFGLVWADDVSFVLVALATFLGAIFMSSSIAHQKEHITVPIEEEDHFN